MCLRIAKFAISRVGRGGSSGRELGQRMIHVDDLIESSEEKVALSAVAGLLRPHQVTLAEPTTAGESRPVASINLQEMPLHNAAFWQKPILNDATENARSEYFTGDLKNYHWL